MGFVVLIVAPLLVAGILAFGIQSWLKRWWISVTAPFLIYLPFVWEMGTAQATDSAVLVWAAVILHASLIAIGSAAGVLAARRQLPAVARGLLIAPLASPILGIIPLLFQLPAMEGPPVLTAVSALLVFALLLTLPWYALATLVLLPIHFALRRYKVTSLVAYQLAFACVGMLVGVALFPTPQSFVDLGLGPGVGTRLVEFLSAVLVATLFWLIVVRKPPAVPAQP